VCFEGGSLKEFIRLRGPFRDKEIVDYSFQLLSGVKYLHDNNIVHHDIKGIYLIYNLVVYKVFVC